jgi:monofunctional biosynthetic peptidoglycan transglycosylase
MGWTRLRSTRRTGGGVWRTLGRALWRIAVVLVAIPLVLVPVYRFVPPVSTLMIFDWVTSGGAVDRRWVPLADIDPMLAAAVIMSEDGKFCSHNGVDWAELGKVLDRSSGPNRGASTVAMQSVKNLFLWPSRSYLRKAVEMPLALYADLVWGKAREMEIYLNVVEWGPNLFGAEAAAQRYFKVSARTLSLSQAALMVAALPNPSVRNPGKPSAGLRSLARTIAARARASGAYIDCLYPQGSL